MKNALQFLFAFVMLGLACLSVEALGAEKKVKLEQLPAPIKDAIVKAIGKGSLIDIGELNAGGKTTYEIEMHLNGTEIDVLFDDQGNELGRNIEAHGDGHQDANDDEKAAEDKDDEKTAKFQHVFDIEHRQLSTIGRNRYFILEPGHQLILEGKDGKDDARLEITVLNETKDIGKIQTRIVEERETVNGKLVEVSRNFFAICQNTKSVFYFGEEVDIYRDGKIVDHHGAWLHGQNNARAGMMMPGECLIGAAYYQEFAPNVAMDRGRIEAVSANLKTPVGEFTDCLKVWEENPLDGDSETKTFAPGIGLVQDEGLLLIQHGFVEK